MSQISHWFDLSQVYNSKKNSFDYLSRDKSFPSKVLGDASNPPLTDGSKIRMPSCPNDGTVQETRKVSPNCTGSAPINICQRGALPNSCLGCQVPVNQRVFNGIVAGVNPVAPPSRAPGTRDGCFIGGE